jgi:hypothetical protein
MPAAEPETAGTSNAVQGSDREIFAPGETIRSSDREMGGSVEPDQRHERQP